MSRTYYTLKEEESRARLGEHYREHLGGPAHVH